MLRFFANIAQVVRPASWAESSRDPAYIKWTPEDDAHLARYTILDGDDEDEE